MIKVTPSFVLGFLNDYDMFSVKMLLDLFKGGLVKENPDNPLELLVGQVVLVPIGPAEKRGLYRYQWGEK